MKPILVLYTSREGQTRRIAEHILVRLKANGLPVELMDGCYVPAEFSLGVYSAAILAASVHLGKHESEMVRFVRLYRNDLEQMPTVFLSVSLSQAGAQDPVAPEAKREQSAADVQRMINTFIAETHWRPTLMLPVAGALMYSKYNFLVRFIMKRIARNAGASTDTSRDHEFTNWAALDDAILDFANALTA